LLTLCCAFVFLLRFLFALSQLGWTRREIAELFDVTTETVRTDIAENCHLAKICDLLGDDWNENSVSESAVGKAMGMSQLGWTQKEIGELFGVTQGVVSESIGNCHLAKIDTLLGENCHLAKIATLLGDDWNGRRGGRKSKASK